MGYSEEQTLDENMMFSLFEIVAESAYFPFRTIHALERRMRNFKFRCVANLHGSVKLLETARVCNIRNKRNAIQVGANTSIRGELLTFAHGGQIVIGEWCYVGEGSRVWSAEQVRIGNRVLISHNVNIHDTNSHPLQAEARHNHLVDIILHGHPQVLEGVTSAAVVIEDDVWIGFSSNIFKGVTIGAKSVIAAGSTVTKDVPPKSLYVYNRVVREIE
jgi:acetyltransferase-like isoleucine patch superfamily enzyme